MSSLTTLSNEELTMKIELVKKYINDLDGIKRHNEHLKTVLKSLIENNTEHINVISDLKNEYALRVLNYKTHMDRYQRELQELEMEKLKRNKRNLCRAVSRNQSRNAVRTLLYPPQIPNIPNSQSGFLRYLSPSLGKTKTASMLSSLAGDRGIARSILNYLTGDDLLPTKDRVYLRELQDKLNELPQEVLLKIWNNLSNRTKLSNIREENSDSDEPMPETGGRRRRRNKTKRNKTKRNKTKRNKTKRNKTIK